MYIGIVGAGRMGRERARATAACGERVKWVCDTDVGRAVRLAGEFGAAVFADQDQVDLSGLDALFICTPPGCRGSLDLTALRANIPLFIEKPLGLSARQCAPLLDALQQYSTVNAVGYMNRYRASVSRARELIAHGVPIAAGFHWLGTRYTVPWWLNSNHSGGPLNEQSTHFIDLCRFLLGTVTDVQATARPLPGMSHIEGTVAMTLRFESGVVAAGLYGCEATQKQVQFEVFMADRSIRLSGWDLELAGDKSSTSGEDIFVKETAAFFQAVRSGDASSVLSNIESALETQRVVDAIRRAVRSDINPAACA